MAQPVPPSTSAEASTARRIRFGLTVGKRLARRSVDRVLIKRILREAARHSAPLLEHLAPADLHIVLRLKAPLPPRETTPRTRLKRALRADADAVLRRLGGRLTAGQTK